MTPNTSLLGVIYHACTSTPVYHTKFEVPSFTNSKDMIGAKKILFIGRIYQQVLLDIFYL